MSTVFDVPCPDCGRQMAVAAEGDLECAGCRRTYHTRMGHLFPVAEPPGPAVVGGGSPSGVPTGPTKARS